MGRQGSEARIRKTTSKFASRKQFIVNSFCLSYNLEKNLSGFSWFFLASEPCPPSLIRLKYTSSRPY
jgi:hypothetical protein